MSFKVSKSIPYAPDLRKMDEAFPKLAIGQALTWEELATASGWPLRSSRFNSLLTAWRKRVFRERNQLLVSLRGKGLVVASPEDRVSHSSNLQRHGLRRVVKSAVIVARTDLSSLPEHSRRTAEHVVQVASALRLVASTKPKELPAI